MTGRRRWTEDEDTYLYTHYQTQPARAIAEHLGRAATAVRKRATAKGCRKTAVWTADDKAFIAAHPSWPTVRLAAALSRTVRATRRMRRLVLERQRPYEAWTDGQLAYLAEHYADTPNKELARALGHTASSVTTVAGAHGLRKSAAYMAGVRERAAVVLRAASRSKAAATTARIRKIERCRVALGLPQKTRMRLGKEPHAKGLIRRRLMSYGYIMMGGDRHVLYYTPDTDRRPRSEATAARHGIKIKTIEDYGKGQ